ncbi:unnamed protein product [Clonostachys byssicola]|uniref:Uncharacterized protein n=1 Tax=Clonostachys byssicola TaxID=160290 RepID=A0A9N9Y2H0_9HYPO|nr:unnamed protein product [Clonostachys byssicola]
MAQFVTPSKYGLLESPSTQKLTPLDMNVPRVYGARWILCFPLENGADYHEVYDKLRIGLAHTIRSIPWIAGVIGPEEGSEISKNRIQIVESLSSLSFWSVHTQPSISYLSRTSQLTPSLPLPSYRDLTDVLPPYDDLKADGFPLSRLSTDDVGPIGVMAEPPQPVMKAQANFVKGGLLLSVGIHHAAGDATALDTIIGIWAQNTAAASGCSSFSTYDSPSHDREPLMNGISGAPLSHFPEYQLIPASQLPPAQMSPQLPSLVTHVFCFSPQTLAELKSSAAAFSTNDALCAFLWSRMTVARWTGEASSTQDDTTNKASSMWYAINIRSRTSPPLPPTYLGNGSMCTTTEPLTAATLLGENGLKQAATAIRKSLVAFNSPNRVPLTIGLLGSRPDPTDFKLLFNAFLGPNVVATSWTDVKVYERNWGALGFIDSMRVPGEGSDGNIIILPRLRDGSLEIVVGLESEAMSRLLADEAFNKFATRCA